MSGRQAGARAARARRRHGFQLCLTDEEWAHRENDLKSRKERYLVCSLSFGNIYILYHATLCIIPLSDENGMGKDTSLIINKFVGGWPPWMLRCHRTRSVAKSGPRHPIPSPAEAEEAEDGLQNRLHAPQHTAKLRFRSCRRPTPERRAHSLLPLLSPSLLSLTI